MNFATASALVLSAMTVAQSQTLTTQAVQLQGTTPGTAQAGNVNVTGTVIAGSLKGDGAQVNNLNAGSIASGTLADARLSSNIARLGSTQTFTGSKTFSTAPSFSASGAAFSVANSTKITNLNCDQLDGLDSSAFLQSVPVPLVLNSAVLNSTALQVTADNGDDAVAVHGISNSGVGLQGDSNEFVAIRGTSNDNIGIFGVSWTYVGVAGQSNSVGSAGVLGYNGNSGPGVSGAANSGIGVVGYGTANGVQGTTSGASTSGVYGEGPGSGYGVAGRVVGANQGCVGVFADAPSGMLSLYATQDTFLGGDLFVAGAKTGYVADIVRNVGNEPLQCGDLVEIVGSSEPVLGEIPVIDVRKATSATPRAVLGPIANALSVKPSALVPPPLADGTPGQEFPKGAMDIRRIDGDVKAGAYASVVTLGSFKSLKVDASYGAIRPGDLLVASPNPGYAMLAIDAPTGTVIGKALGSLQAGSGSIAVIVDQQ